MSLCWAGMRCRAVMAGICGLRAIRGRFYTVAAATKLSNAEISQRRSTLYDKEKERQLSLHPLTEKIEVTHVGKTDPGTIFVMNKGISTPYNCAMHLSEWYCDKSVLAVVDGEVWDMYKPLTKSCNIQFLTFSDEDPEEVNKAYWRSCAAILGHVLEQAFKDDYMVNLVRAPEIPVISGAFCYDMVLDPKLDDWKPTKENLHSFTRDALKLISKDLPFECLEVEEKVARDIFQHNPYKLMCLEEKAANHPEGKVTLHRFGEFVDLTEGPHIPSTSVCMQYEVTAAHSIVHISTEQVRRFQGLSLPWHLKAHHTVWNKLRIRAQKLVTEKQSTQPEPAV
ncbi:PREDICTED: 39S ribosomal protein L39, mitochondrial [Nanorana parkeri]|uniref:39S ribosomal protein L39, mitochondrial n=1 Tax=Nanorana parkeri TaxID=125878 RepID=UPI00085456E0|nr:PREDICTED: 39S ribosomal protein L39, mitochondrial [Nanorana parkeri]